MPLRIGLISAFPVFDGGGSTGGGTNPIIITTSSFPPATVGVAYSATLTAIGGRAPYTWSIGGGALPAGLSLSSSGNITGTPSAAGVSNFTVQVVDTAGNSGRMGVHFKA